jgi:subtilase family serine protease
VFVQVESVEDSFVKRKPHLRFTASCARLVFIAFTFAAGIRAQALPTRLVTQAIDDGKTVPLRGTIHPLAQSRFDRGAVPDSFPAERMLLMLYRPPDREAGLQQFLQRVHTAGSASYHQWLTPEQIGDEFGPADSDVQTAVSWLNSHGFTVARTTKGKNLIEFSGTAGQLREAFHAEIHQYNIQNETHYANATDLAIPEALAQLVRGVSPINNFRAKPAVHVVGRASYSRSTKQVNPQFTNPNGETNFYALAPEDFATEYDLAPLYGASVDGTGQTIGIIISSNIDLSVANAYRQLFHLPSNPPQIVIDGSDPGEQQDAGTEAYLDAELSGAIAPNATVNLYISGGSQVADPLMLAAVRAIEDDQATVLTASFESCESSLGPAGNPFWSSLWEQAAAQGQTVFVSAGDAGSAGCDFFNFEQSATRGLAVNGIASTPWNVAVGGTDFYYADYATGAPSAATFWNQTNDSALGSLKERLPEQAWNEPFGFNVFGGPTSIVASGGGASSCALFSYDSSGNAVCQAGYPKPVWQNAPGVPSDGVRDLPDVSLFAASGSNRSAYPICADVGDCSISSGDRSTILLVGGTSASSPAMAGIMALINQKYGRQGQANFTLYALARQQPAVFHDITIGSNNVPCDTGSPNCSLDTNGDGFHSLQEYPAGPGYDLATGLGSLDANALVADWRKAVFQPTTTTLSLSPTTFIHGTQVLIKSTVTPATGSGTPTGDIGLITNGALQLPQGDAFRLASGVVDTNTFLFPGGAYQVTAEYAGDGDFTASNSPPVTLTVTPESSSIQFTAYSPTGNVVNADAQADYGYHWLFSVEPIGMTNLGSTLHSTATGTVTITDGATSQQVALNSLGIAEWSPSDLAVGAHPFTITYPGDASYLSSTAGPFTVMVAKGRPTMLIPAIETSVPVGGNLIVTLLLGSGIGTAPTGNISFTLALGGTTVTTVTAPLTPILIAGAFPWATATAAFTNLQTAGSFSLNATYNGDNNWTAVTQPYSDAITVSPSALLASTIAASVSPTSINRLQSAELSATVSGVSGATTAPTGTVVFYVDGQGLPVTLEPKGPTTSMARASDQFSALTFSNGNNSILAVYQGDATYKPSASAPVTLNVDLSYFSLTLGASRVVIPAGQSGNVTINLNGVAGVNLPLALACAPSSSNIGCAVNPPAPMVSGSTAATLVVNAFVVVQGAASNLPSPLGGSVWSHAGFGAIFVVAFLIGFPYRRRGSMMGLSFFVLLLFTMGCGSVSAPSPPPASSNVPAPPGTYNILVTGMANGTIHNVKLTVIVQ